MFNSIEETIRFIESEKIPIIDVRVIDLLGRWHHISIPSSGAGELFESGIPFDSSSIPGFRGVNCGDMCLSPDVKSAFLDPFTEMPTLVFICQIIEADTGEGLGEDPRSVLVRAEKLLKDKLDADSMWLPEIEFYLFDEASYGTGKTFGFFDFVSKEAETETGFIHPPTGGYHAIPPSDAAFDLRNEIIVLAQNAGIPIRYHHHEVGPYGQHEVEMMLASPLAAADNVMKLKYIIRMAALERGLAATFMPKPLYDEAGSGMHFHQFLSRNGVSLFWDEKGEYSHMSELGFHFIAGVLEHAPSLVAITNPSTNSFKRLVPGFEAPTKRFFGLANRSAAIRIPKYDDVPALKRFEFRPPDATCNPYLAIAAQMLAGMDGAERKLDPTALGYGPFDDNVDKWPLSKRKRLKDIPADLATAVDALDKDRKFLTKDGVFSDSLIDRHIEFARKYLTDISKHPVPREMELYFDI
ncbi:MAG TPA: type I glutamate--ammonia ligase [candidate division Zixibacteria bacterium]|nr:type I glutamate--ammonia ligase [candidate division Zixibacteria bacterium]